MSEVLPQIQQEIEDSIDKDLLSEEERKQFGERVSRLIAMRVGEKAGDESAEEYLQRSLDDLKNIKEDGTLQRIAADIVEGDGGETLTDAEVNAFLQRASEMNSADKGEQGGDTAVAQGERTSQAEADERAAAARAAYDDAYGNAVSTAGAAEQSAEASDNKFQAASGNLDHNGIDGETVSRAKLAVANIDNVIKMVEGQEKTTQNLEILRGLQGLRAKYAAEIAPEETEEQRKARYWEAIRQYGRERRAGSWIGDEERAFEARKAQEKADKEAAKKESKWDKLRHAVKEKVKNRKPFRSFARRAAAVGILTFGLGGTILAGASAVANAEDGISTESSDDDYGNEYGDGNTFFGQDMTNFNAQDAVLGGAENMGDALRQRAQSEAVSEAVEENIDNAEMSADEMFARGAGIGGVEGGAFGAALEQMMHPTVLDFANYDHNALEQIGRARHDESFINARGLQRSVINGILTNTSEFDSQDKLKEHNFGLDKTYLYDLDEGVREAETRKELLKLNGTMTQPLASTMANFPSALRACGIDEEIINISDVEKRAQALDELMTSTREGKEIFDRLTGALELITSSDQTEWSFVTVSGPERSFLMEKIDKDEKSTPYNILLRMTNVTRDNAKQVVLKVKYADGTEESCRFNLKCGFQPTYSVEKSNSTKKKVERVETVVQPVVVEEQPVVVEQRVVETTPETVTTTTVEDKVDTVVVPPAVETPEDKVVPPVVVETPEEIQKPEETPKPIIPPAVVPEIVPPKNEEAEIKNATHEGQDNVVSKTDDSEAGFAGSETEAPATVTREEGTDRIMQDQAANTTQSAKEQTKLESNIGEAEQIEESRAEQTESERREQENDTINSILAGLSGN